MYLRVINLVAIDLPHTGYDGFYKASPNRNCCTQNSYTVLNVYLLSLSGNEPPVRKTSKIAGVKPVGISKMAPLKNYIVFTPKI